MSTHEIIQLVAKDGVVLAVSDAGNVLATGDKDAIERWLNIIRENKAAILDELNRDRRREKVQAMLESKPSSKYAVFVENADADLVICTVGIRRLATFEMAIPHHSYDALALVDLIEQHSIESEGAQ